MNVANVMSSKCDEWETPQYVLGYLAGKGYNFTLDPCASQLNHKFDKFYTVDDNGLSKSWTDEVVFVNPPYSKVAPWIKKCYDEYDTCGATSVMLIAARPETKAWFNYIRHAPLIEFVMPRVKFELNGVACGSPTFGSAIVYFDHKLDNLTDTYFTPTQWIELRGH